jgi:hypothetical protein
MAEQTGAVQGQAHEEWVVSEEDDQFYKQCAEEVRGHHEKHELGLKRLIMDHVVKAGEILLRARERAGHGNWGKCFERYFTGISRDTAEDWMHVSKVWPRMDRAMQKDPLLTVAQVKRNFPKRPNIRGTPATTRTKVEVKQTPVEEARRGLIKWLTDRVNNLFEYEAKCLYARGESRLDDLWGDLIREVTPLDWTVGAEQRFHEAMEAPEARKGSEGWKEKRKAARLAFRQTILNFLAKREDLTGWQRDVIEDLLVIVIPGRRSGYPDKPFDVVERLKDAAWAGAPLNDRRGSGKPGERVPGCAQRFAMRSHLRSLFRDPEEDDPGDPW